MGPRFWRSDRLGFKLSQDFGAWAARCGNKLSLKCRMVSPLGNGNTSNKEHGSLVVCPPDTAEHLVNLYPCFGGFDRELHGCTCCARSMYADRPLSFASAAKQRKPGR